jgi:hypothetical protein
MTRGKAAFLMVSTGLAIAGIGWPLDTWEYWAAALPVAFTATWAAE